MFGRLKQRVKEKTGRAKATQLPDDVADLMEYYKNLPGRIKAMSGPISDFSDVFKLYKRTDMLGSIQNLSHANSQMQVGPLIEALEQRAKAEIEAISKVQAEVDKFKSFINSECKTQSSACSNVNKSRLNMDGAGGALDNNETDANKTKFDLATRDYNAALDRVRDLGKTIANDEAEHAKWITAIVGYTRLAFQK